MRRGKIVSLIGVVIVVTGILCNLNSNKTYEKKVQFSTIDEIVQILNSDELVLDHPNDYSKYYTDEFNECLSKRKRLTNAGIEYSYLDVEEKEENNTQEEQERILKSYKSMIENLKDIKIPKRIKAISLEGKAYPIALDDSIKESKSYFQDAKIDIVCIDEGEGWVIDYFWVWGDSTTMYKDDPNIKEDLDPSGELQNKELNVYPDKTEDYDPKVNENDTNKQ